ncbi:MAG: hypothetical protein WBS24_15850 [Terriglobales bacterium]
MGIRTSLILGCALIAAQLIAPAQQAFARDAMAQTQSQSSQNPGGQTTQSAPNQSSPAQSAPAAASGTQSSQSSNGAEQGTSQGDSGAAPAAALTGFAGLEGGGTDTALELPQIPSLLGGRGMSLAFPAELERSNYLRGGVNVGAAYDDNPLLMPSGTIPNSGGLTYPHPESDTNESVYGNIRIDESYSRMRWSLGYAGGLTVNQKLTNQDEGSHNVNFDSLFRLSPHVNLRVAENFSLTTGMFDAAIAGQTTGAGGPNMSVLTPLSTQRATLTTVETNYHFALNDLVGASGSYYDLSFANVPAALTTAQTTQTDAALSDTQSSTGGGFWLHKIFRGDWAGVSYRFERITFNPDGESRVHSFLAVNTLNAGNRFSLSFFGGAQYADNQALVAGATPGTTLFSESTSWSPTGGIEAGWRNGKTSLLAGYSRSVSDGGGVLGAVQLGNAYGSFRREVAPGWSVTATGGYGTNAPLLPATIVSSSSGATSTNLNALNLTSAGAALERNVGKKLGLRLGYTHDFQQQDGVGDISRNRFIAMLSYQWSKPLGM